MSNLDNRISNADQLLTTDIDKFCESVTDVYSNVSKPILDIVLYVYRLTMTLGGRVSIYRMVDRDKLFKIYVFSHHPS